MAIFFVLCWDEILEKTESFAKKALLKFITRHYFIYGLQIGNEHKIVEPVEKTYIENLEK